MGNLFKGIEVVEIGVQIEINGRDFYNTLVAQAKDEKSKELFQFLAGEEEAHIRSFNKLLDLVRDYQPPESYTGEYFDYMSSLAGEHVFTQKGKGAEIAKNIKDDKEAIEVAIGFEKDSVVFYEGMKKVVPEADLRIVDALIAQENEHLRKLEELRELM